MRPFCSTAQDERYTAGIPSSTASSPTGHMPTPSAQPLKAVLGPPLDQCSITFQFREMTQH